MHTLREWRDRALERGYTRIAELADYLQADELTHVKLATRWIRQLTADDPACLADLVAWSRAAVLRIQRFYAEDPANVADDMDIRFTFLRPEKEESE